MAFLGGFCSFCLGGGRCLDGFWIGFDRFWDVFWTFWTFWGCLGGLWEMFGMIFLLGGGGERLFCFFGGFLVVFGGCEVMFV